MHDRVTQIYVKPQLSPAQVAAFASALGVVVNSCIEALDILAGDADFEANGDELDFNRAEDDHGDFAEYADGPGCEYGDPGGCEHDGRELELGQ
ncbi:hypothetical protein SH584_04040 [Sphingomonas sp. LY29]|uniref:hypothetical protein n=1 Tax=Sphingomonas sp. LY29 TaxID=3095341 RepID=UPI002D776BE5|nr:hypothetical protein [Sphingomonas sp. LY29]WRP26612.1 hypothetical protein SH584_04040 [Sphingomonas sp. LY29]